MEWSPGFKIRASEQMGGMSLGGRSSRVNFSYQFSAKTIVQSSTKGLIQFFAKGTIQSSAKATIVFF